MSELYGEAWLASAQNRAYEHRVVRKIYPFILGASLVSRAGVRIIDRQQQVTARHTRALIPGQDYQIEKLGRPGSRRPVSNLLERFMLDEIPQLTAVYNGSAPLVGPRGTTPEYRRLLFDAMDDGTAVDQWTKILERQRPGLLSTYSLRLHSIHDGPFDESGLSLREVQAEAFERYEADSRDWYDASQGHSAQLGTGFTHMVTDKLKHMVVHMGQS